ncbi:DNA-binding protein [Pasteurellaceae bacterium 15-036681]|nr:DNA-binding protein [Pasteurellaceae bacterium 15-036681]
MDQKEIYQALKNKDLNAAMIAEALEVSTQAVSNAIKQGKGSKRIAKAVAIAIDRPLEQVFPHYAQKQQKQVIRNAQVNQLRTRFSQII